MNVDTAPGRLPLVLLVDSAVASRHALWRTLHRALGVLEADSAASARTWLARRPDIDALVVHGDLPDGDAEELAREWTHHHPGVRRAVVLATASVETVTAKAQAFTHVEAGDLRGIVEGLAAWLSARDSGLARLLLRDADRLLV